MNRRLLDALQGKNAGPPPVWFMRQAGRFLPEYRKLREAYTLSHLFHTPALAAQVTLQPVDRLGVDAAILFSDILVITEALGYTIDFPQAGGIRLHPPVTPQTHSVPNTLHYVRETIELLKPQLAVPLIGFCGGPYTVARYMDRVDHPTLRKLTDASIEYLQMQVAAGADAVQVFDSWAGTLEPLLFTTYALPYLKEIVDALRPTPLILFCRGSCRYVDELVALEPTAIGFDWEKPLAELRERVPAHIALQGNIDPELFRGPLPPLLAAARDLLESMKEERRFIMNLGHGVLPDTPVENAIELVRLVSEEKFRA